MKKNLFIIMATVVFFSAFASAEINLTCPVNYNFTFVNSSLENETQIFNCFANNITINITTNITPNVSYFNFSLDSGQSYFSNSSFCFVNATCNNPINSTNVCSISRTLNSGEHYVNSGGACSIDMTCKDVCDDLITDSKQTEHFRLYSEDAFVYLKYKGREERFLKNSTFNYETDLEFICPASLDAECKDTNIVQTKEVQELLTQLDRINSDLESCMDTRTDLKACYDQRYENAQQFFGNSSSLSERAIICEQQMTGLEDSYNRCLEEKADQEGEKGIYWAFITLLAVSLGASLILNALLFFYFMRQRKSVIIAQVAHPRTKRIITPNVPRIKDRHGRWDDD